jgi:aryl-alcohol dehydrogenase-like predicted oxidoreductase
MHPTRRQFLKTTALGATTLGLPAKAANPGALSRRQFGRHPEELSLIGFGGIVVSGVEQDHANRVVAEFVEKGVNYFDVAPSYGDAEVKLGPALEPYRKQSFLACKTNKRTAAEAKEEFARSLERLRTDHFDLYQLHSLTDVEKDVDAAFAAGGVMELLLEEKKQGRIKYLGFSAHSVAAALAALNRYEFDSVLFPVNFASWMDGDFGPQILKLAYERGAARLALKAMARGRWKEGDPRRQDFKKCWYEPLSDPREADLGLRFTLSQPVTSAIPPGDENLFRLAVDLAMKFRPIDDKGEAELAALAKDVRLIFPA